MMLGSFYGKMWDLERWALADLRQEDLAATSASFYIDTPQPAIKRPRAKTHSSCFGGQKMHLPQQNDMLHLGGGGMTNGTSGLLKCSEGTYHEKDLTNGVKSSVFANGSARANEVFVATPPDLVDAVIAGWVILAHRYQRDAFHNFTIGLEGSGETRTHTVSASELDLLRIQTVTDLLNSVRSVKPADILSRANIEPAIILNDGTTDEVR